MFQPFPFNPNGRRRVARSRSAIKKQIFENKRANMRNYLTKFSWIFEFGAVQKCVNILDLVESFHTSIYLQNSASIQPRTKKQLEQT